MVVESQKNSLAINPGADGGPDGHSGAGSGSGPGSTARHGPDRTGPLLFPARAVGACVAGLAPNAGPLDPSQVAHSKPHDSPA